MTFQESLEWSLLLGANSIPGKTKIECIKIILKREPRLYRKKIMLDSFLKKIVFPGGEFLIDSHYYRLKFYYQGLKENPSIIKEKSGWEDEIEVPLRRLFNSLEIPFYFKSSYEFKKAVLKHYQEWNLYDKYDYYEVVVEFIEKEIAKLGKLKDTLEHLEPKKEIIVKDLTFGFFGDKKILSAKLHELCFKIDLLNSDFCEKVDLEKILFAEKINSNFKDIHINCETVVFKYILNKLQPYFHHLTLSNIEKSQLFYSKRGKILKAQNLYSSTFNNPKLKTKIDMIFKD